MNIKKLSMVLVPVLLLSVLATVPFNRSYNKNVEAWMGKVSDDTKLIDMSIPGTHDSGATHSLFEVAGKCQDTTIKQQLNMGVRFFDLRLQLVNDEFRLIHGPADQNLKLKSVLKDLTSFIEEHESEFLIVSFKEESGSKNSTKSFEEVLKENLNEYGDIFSLSKELPLTVKEARGKIHILSRYTLDFGYQSYEGWEDDTTFTLNDLYVQDNYSIPNVEEKIEDIKATIAISNDPNNDKLVLNFTSCYLSNGFPPLYAGTAGRDINRWFNGYLEENKDAKLGIIVADFMTQELSQEIYRRNY